MPDPRVKPVAENDSSASDEASKLELYLQRQLEEDVARYEMVLHNNACISYQARPM